MEQKLEKVMVFKELHQLPNYLKRIPEYIPQPLERVIVLEQIPNHGTGHIEYLRVRFGEAKKTVLSAIYFRTMAEEKLRRKLLTIHPSTQQIQRLLERL